MHQTELEMQNRELPRAGARDDGLRAKRGREAARAAGYDEQVCKPVTPALLVETIAKLTSPT